MTYLILYCFFQPLFASVHGLVRGYSLDMMMFNAETSMRLAL